MEVPRWRDTLEGTRAAYARDLEACGFTQTEEKAWTGSLTVPADGDATERRGYRIELPDDFPFAWPLVYFADPPAIYDWHLGPLGQLCLWRREDTDDRPWETVDGLFNRIRLWHERALQGWPGDEGDLDLERFFDPDPEYTLITYSELSELIGRRISSFGVGQSWKHLKPSGAARQQRRRATHWAYGADLGVLKQPVWDWSTTLAAMRADDRNEVERLARTIGPGLLLLRYERDGATGLREAAIVLTVRPRSDSTPELLHRTAVQDTPSTRIRRAGHASQGLAGLAVAIVGCGAIGSFLAEMLARAGIGTLVLIDPERLMPGNCIRHLASLDHVPQFKVDAIESILAARQLATSVVTHRARLHPELAFAVLIECDLVIDAAADGGATGLLEHLAGLTAKTFLKIALHRDGGILRVDRLGAGTAQSRPAAISDTAVGDRRFREAGCGDPISPTPPEAVLAAASAACRMAIDTLQPLRRRRLPDSMIEILTPQPDSPYDKLGIL